MIEDKKIAVIVPAHNEEKLIGKTLMTMPEFVDSIMVVNDGSTDQTGSIIDKIGKQDSRIIHIKKGLNEGLGKAIIDGYRKAYEQSFDIVAVMAGDAQMHPDDLIEVVQPIISGQAMYVKGNRLLSPGVFNKMPKYRFLGNSLLTLLTKFTTGYFHLMDPQCGYTAITHSAIGCLDLDSPHQGYGYNAHILYQLNLHNIKVTDVEVRPIYENETSGIRLSSYIPKVGWLLIVIFFRRIWFKYFLFDFHPVGLCYLFGSLSGLLALQSGLFIAVERFSLLGPLPITLLPTIMLWVLSSFCAIILILFAIFMDIEYLRVRENSTQVSRYLKKT